MAERSGCAEDPHDGLAGARTAPRTAEVEQQHAQENAAWKRFRPCPPTKARASRETDTCLRYRPCLTSTTTGGTIHALGQLLASSTIQSWNRATYVTDSSPPSLNVGGVEKELPRFHLLARYPTEPEKEWTIVSDGSAVCEDGALSPWNGVLLGWADMMLSWLPCLGVDASAND
ncbi:hypothetical protein G6O67_002601 [Ophiocordyceps sinensis]|uniref:Uncharacterized protein n=1 Tax=Ophiocordyceps sinensis TaxID=72228 RepID=A0A8H4PUH3_9HYPO|nr:hypothetical protein G6O67_002601 [Ophiocordyceps sinensis]